MRAQDEIANLSDDALRLLDKMFIQQYKLGFEYATECWGGVIHYTEVQDTLSKVCVSHEPEYLRELIKARV
jgi:hypothetical protein